MSSSVRTLFLGFIHSFLVLLSLGGQASSQTTEPQAVNPQIDRIERMMQFFYVNPKYRTSVDTAELSNKTLKISQWRGLPPDPSPQKIECLGYQWLLSGRGKKMGEGASQVFKENPEIEKIVLELVELEGSLVSTDHRGKYEKAVKKRPYLRMTAERAAFENFPMKARALKTALQKSTSECLRIGRLYITEKEIQL
jgi:hypothetical protein